MKTAILGLLTFFPLSVFLFLCSTFIYPGLLDSPYLPLITLSTPVVWGTLAYYLWHMAHNQRLSDRSRLYWVFGLVIGGLVGLPLYWYKYIFNQK